ncbi:hypothetical protein C0431_06710 [bacterium]|nr:hypothetical protein [bacterium]
MKKLILIAAPLCLATSALAQVSFTGGTYTQNFNSLPSTGSATWTNNSTLVGWSAITDATASITTVGAGVGTSTTAGLYGFGIASASDRAIGFVASNAFTGASSTGRGYIGVLIQNTSSDVLENIVVGYTGEQWRKENNSSANALSFSYSLNNTSLTSGVYNFVNPMGFASPITGATSATALDGNQNANRAVLSTSLTGVSLNPGDTIMIRFIDLNDSGNDHILAVDDFNFSAEAVPEPATMTILAGAAAMAALRRRKK